MDEVVTWLDLIVVAAVWPVSIGTRALAAAVSSSENDSGALQVIVCIEANVQRQAVCMSGSRFIEFPLTNELHGEYSITRSLIAVREHGGGPDVPADHGFSEENIID